jgi:hypothetical protein
MEFRIKLVKDVRECIEGAYDMHVHSAPDALPRTGDDIDFAKIAKEYGMRGFVIKNHYFPSCERAQLVNKILGPEIKVFGSIVLNNTVGGINPQAVYISAKMDCKVVWMPTIDAENEKDTWKRYEKLPYWAKIQKELALAGRLKDPISIWNKDGEFTHEFMEVIDIIKEFDLVLATGHLRPEESIKVIDYAFRKGVKKIVVTHPDFPTTRFPIEAQKQLVENYKVYLERCFTTPYTNKVSWVEIINAIRETGANYNIISTDLGQPNAPYPAKGLVMFIERLLEYNIPVKDIQKMTIYNPHYLLEG